MIKNLLWNIDDFVNDDSIKSTIVYFLSSVNPTLKKSRRLCYVGGTPFATLPPFRNTFSTNENFASGPLSATLPKNYDLLNLKNKEYENIGGCPIWLRKTDQIETDISETLEPQFELIWLRREAHRWHWEITETPWPDLASIWLRHQIFHEYIYDWDVLNYVIFGNNEPQ